MTRERESRHWTFTLNNPCDADDESLVTIQNMCDYFMYGEEVGEQGTPHLQGYFCLKTKRRFRALHKINPRIHFEGMKTTPTACINYCKKDGKWHEWGTLPQDQGTAGGKATAEKYKQARKLAESGKLQDIDDVLYTRHFSAYQAMARMNPVVPDPLSTVCGYWYWGPPGTGKTTAALAIDSNPYLKETNKWWDGYRGQETVIVDEVEVGDLAMGHYLKKWADKFPFPAEMKGTSSVLRPQRIIVTSNYSIDQVFGSDAHLCAALKDRFVQKHFVVRYRVDRE